MRGLATRHLVIIESYVSRLEWDPGWASGVDVDHVMNVDGGLLDSLYMEMV